MDWTQFLLLFITIAGMMYSLKSDAREDRKRSAEDRKDIISMIRISEKESKEFREKMAIFQERCAEETKEFHGRLCTLEERYLQIITKGKG